MKRSGARRGNLPVGVLVEGVTGGTPWACGMEFLYANSESFHCRPLRLGGNDRVVPVPPWSFLPKVAFLGALSGVAPNETVLMDGAVRKRIGEGRSGETLRNLCYKLAVETPEGETRWGAVSDIMSDLYAVRPEIPHRIAARGELEMRVVTARGVTLDVAAAGRGYQQALLLLAFATLHPGGVLLLDDPVAGMDPARQARVWEALADLRTRDTQIVYASCSTALADKTDTVVVFDGAPTVVNEGRAVPTGPPRAPGGTTRVVLPGMQHQGSAGGRVKLQQLETPTVPAGPVIASPV